MATQEEAPKEMVLGDGTRDGGPEFVVMRGEDWKRRQGQAEEVARGSSANMCSDFSTGNLGGEPSVLTP